MNPLAQQPQAPSHDRKRTPPWQASPDPSVEGAASGLKIAHHVGQLPWARTRWSSAASGLAGLILLATDPGRGSGSLACPMPFLLLLLVRDGFTLHLVRSKADSLERSRGRLLAGQGVWVAVV